MSFLKIAKNRYTTKQYDPSKKIDVETIEKLKEIIRLSPSSINSQPWKFTFVSDEKVKSKLANLSYNNKQKVLDSSHIVVFGVTKDAEAFENNKLDRKSTRLNSSHVRISYAVFCLKKKKNKKNE